MENIIIGIAALTIGFVIGHILGSRKEAEKHRACHRRMRKEIESLPGIMFGIDLAKKESSGGVMMEAEIKNGKLVSMKKVNLPADFGKMKDESHPLSKMPSSIGVRKVPVKSSPKKRVSKPRTPEQKERAKLKMRERRARIREAKK